MSRQGQGNIKAMQNIGQGKVKAGSRQCHERVKARPKPSQGEGEVKAEIR